MTVKSKAELRRDLLAARRSMTIANQQDQDRVVRETATAWLHQMGTEAAMGADRNRGAGAPDELTIAAYHPMTGEPGGPSLPAALSTHATTVLLPVVLGDRDLDWARFEPDVPDGGLAPAGLGLHEPTGARLGADAITTARVIFVPALAVDPSGARLGRGGGSFDRALARVRAPQLVIALLYDGELLPAVPAEAHDRPVDGVVISGEITIFGKM